MSNTSKTEISCDCGWLSGAINDPGAGVFYDPVDNRIYIGNRDTKYCVYHCPFCGGKYPDQSMPLWVPIVPQAEFERIGHLAEGLTTVDMIFAKLGLPDYDAATYPKRDFRTMEYHALSKLLNLEFVITKQGQVKSAIHIKSLSPRHRMPEIDYDV